MGTLWHVQLSRDPIWEDLPRRGPFVGKTSAGNLPLLNAWPNGLPGSGAKIMSWQDWKVELKWSRPEIVGDNGEVLTARQFIERIEEAQLYGRPVEQPYGGAWGEVVDSEGYRLVTSDDWC